MWMQGGVETGEQESRRYQPCPRQRELGRMVRSDGWSGAASLSGLSSRLGLRRRGAHVESQGGTF